MKIITNHHTRNLFTYEEIPESAQSDLDWCEPDDLCFRYKDQWYALNEFVVFGSMWSPEHPAEFKTWHASKSDSFFSGILIRIPDDDPDSIIVGWYLS